jgi:protein-tyrosine phosphatase
MISGLIDVHSHLLPGIDDGCASVEESIACARVLVENGYTHSFCTPHIWTNLPNNSVQRIPQLVDSLQGVFDQADVPLTLYPGGELNARPGLDQLNPADLVTYGMARKHAIIDLWIDALPKYFFDAVKWMQGLGITVILAHPERMRAVQDEPEVVDKLMEMGVLLQGNLQCLGDPPTKSTRQIAEYFLREGKYFMLGSDLHNLAGLEIRMAGLRRAQEIVGDAGIKKLMIDHPKMLIPE